jgi:putative ABC transport system permease protein
VGSAILLNGIRFEIIGVLSKVGQDGNNGTNARIFIPIETMRNLFRLKDQNSEDAISFLNYRPLTPKREPGGETGSARHLARRHGFDPKLTSHSKIGTPSKTTSAWQDLRRHGLFPRRGRDHHACARRHRHHQHHARLGYGTHREIGLRKALGATHRAIMTQFFVEGAFLTALSGGIGLAITTAFVTVLASCLA